MFKSVPRSIESKLLNDEQLSSMYALTSKSGLSKLLLPIDSMTDNGVIIGSDGLLDSFTLLDSVVFLDTVESLGALVVLVTMLTGTDISLGASTTVTRKRECVVKLVGEQLFDEGGVIGDVPGSLTRDTWNRLRDGLGVGDDMGDGIGLGRGDRKRPPDLRFGSSKWRSALAVDASSTGFLMLWHVNDIFREFKKLLRTRLTDVRTGSGSGGFSFRAHNERILLTTRE